MFNYRAGNAFAAIGQRTGLPLGRSSRVTLALACGTQMHILRLKKGTAGKGSGLLSALCERKKKE